MTTEKQIQANSRNATRSTGPKTIEGKNAVRMNAVKHGILSSEAIIRSGVGKENEEEYEALLEGLQESLEPEGLLENMLVQRIADLTWSLRRAQRCETGEIQRSLYADDEASKRQQTLSDIDSGLHFLRELTQSVKSNEYLSGSHRHHLTARFGSSSKFAKWLAERSAEIGGTERIMRMLEDAENPQAAEERDRLRLSPDDRPALLRAAEQETKQLQERKKSLLPLVQLEEQAILKSRALPDAAIMDKILRYQKAHENSLYKAWDRLEHLQRQRKGELVPPPVRVEVSDSR